MKKLITINILALIIIVVGLYLYSKNISTKKQTEDKVVNNVPDKKDDIKKEVIPLSDPMEGDFNEYDNRLYKKFAAKSTSCKIAEPNNIEIKQCAADVSNLADKEIDTRVKSIKTKIASKVDKLPEDDYMLEAIKNVPGQLDNTVREWREYRNTFCVSVNEVSVDGTGYSGFVSGCQYAESFKFMHYLDTIEHDWVDNN